MRKSYILKMQNQLVLSIRYARIKEEIANIEKNIINEKSKEGIAKLMVDKKKIVKNEEYIKDLKKEIENIEENYKPKYYNQYIDIEIFRKKLSKLSKEHNFIMLKYEIAIKVILDGSCEFNTTNNFLEKLSMELFNKKTIFYTLMDNLEEVYCKIKGINAPQIPELKSGIETIGFTPVVQKVKSIGLIAGVVSAKKNVDVVKDVVFRIPRYFKPGLAIITATGIAGGLIGVDIIKRNKISKQIKSLTSEGLEYTLCEVALCILQASNNLDDYELKKYFNQLMILINKSRDVVYQDLYMKWLNKTECQNKLKLYNNFDNYVINFIKSK